MKFKYIHTSCFLLLLCLLCIQAEAQSLFTAGSNLETNPGQDIQVYWSLGEPCISAGNTDKVYITEGFHQPIKPATKLAYSPRLESVRIYPTLAQELIYLDTEAFVSEEKIKYTVFTTRGTQVRDGVLDPAMLQQHTIEVDDLHSGVYFIQIQADKVLPQTYKFVKI